MCVLYTLLLLMQGPAFVSVLYGLRTMVNLPVESMKTGGILWFTDLTIPDPTFALPIATAVTLLITMEVRYSSMTLSLQT